jgi:hypothetical protein
MRTKKTKPSAYRRNDPDKNYQLFCQRWSKGEYQSEEGQVFFTQVSIDFEIDERTAQRWVYLAKGGQERGKRKTRAKSADIFNKLKDSNLDRPILEIAGEHGITYLTARKYIKMIKAGEDYGVIHREKISVFSPKKKIDYTGWTRLKIYVDNDTKQDFDNLPADYREKLFYNVDRAIDKFLHPERLPVVTKPEGTKFLSVIYIKLSQEIVEKWQQLPKDFKKNVWLSQLIANLCHSLLC